MLSIIQTKTCLQQNVEGIYINFIGSVREIGSGILQFVSWRMIGSHFANDLITVFRSAARAVNSAS